LNAPSFKNPKSLEGRAIVTDTFDKCDQVARYGTADTLAGAGYNAHRGGYSVLYGNYATQWYGDTTQQIIYWPMWQSGTTPWQDTDGFTIGGLSYGAGSWAGGSESFRQLGVTADMVCGKAAKAANDPMAAQNLMQSALVWNTFDQWFGIDTQDVRLEGEPSIPAWFDSHPGDIGSKGWYVP
jgi:hypothetical protein